MSKFNILWIDDDWNNKSEPHLQSFLKSTKDVLLSQADHVSVSEKDSVSEGVMSFLQDNFDLLIIDLNFKNGSFTWESIMDYAQKKFLPVIVFSNYIADYESSVHFQKSKSLIIGAFEKTGKADLFIEAVLNFSRFKSINLIQISDFHYDSTLIGAAKAEQQTRFEKLCDTIESLHQDHPFDLIIFTGDFAAKKPVEDFDECFTILQNIVNRTIRDFSKLCIIPGNHDILWDNFETKKLSEKPCKPFYKFWERIYNSDHEVIQNLVGFNRLNRSFDDHYEPDSFNWSKKLNGINLEILGLNTVPMEPALQGLGQVSDSSFAFIQNIWGRGSNPANTKLESNLVRIALLHHNILPPFSINRLEESRNILNAGRTVEALANYGCNIIMSGHCHDSYVYSFSYTVLAHVGYSKTRNLTYISTGTAGGYSPTGDRARAFNIISIRSSQNISEKNMLITPYVYDSRIHTWSAVDAKTVVIKQE